LNKRIFGETVGVISGHYKGRGFPHWFTARFETFSEKEDKLPLDAHYLLALCAPRPLYVASASEDSWADPLGEFLGAVHADPVYHVLGQPGLGTKEQPPVSKSVGQTIGYHLRPGKHDILLEDWKNYADFADRVMPAK
ncbi:MAG: acetylxylan esterase, partial [Opitutales bacterium]